MIRNNNNNNNIDNLLWSLAWSWCMWQSCDYRRNTCIQDRPMHKSRQQIMNTGQIIYTHKNSTASVQNTFWAKGNLYVQVRLYMMCVCVNVTNIYTLECWFFCISLLGSGRLPLDVGRVPDFGPLAMSSCLAPGGV